MSELKNEPTILAVKPGSLSEGAKDALEAAGIIVLEVQEPSEVRFMRPNAELSGTQMLGAALRAIHRAGGNAYFGDEVAKAILSQAAIPVSG